jgi:hypothetical protein
LASIHAARDQVLLELHKCREQPQLMHSNRARIGEVVERDGGLIPAHPVGQRPCETIGDEGPRIGGLAVTPQGRWRHGGTRGRTDGADALAIEQYQIGYVRVGHRIAQFDETF